MYDSDISTHTDDQLQKYIRPFSNLILIILEVTKDLTHLGKSLKKKWSWGRSRNVDSQTKIR